LVRRREREKLARNYLGESRDSKEQSWCQKSSMIGDWPKMRWALRTATRSRDCAVPESYFYSA